MNTIYISTITDRTSRYLCKTEKDYLTYLNENPDAVEVIGEYNQKIKPIFDIDAFNNDIDVDEVKNTILSIFPNKKVVYAKRDPRETKKGMKYSYRFYVLDVKITSKFLKQLLIEKKINEDKKFDLSIYDTNKVLFLPLTTEKVGEKVPPLKPIDCSILECCASYVGENYEDWDVLYKKEEVIKIEVNKEVEEEDDDEDNNVNISKLQELITKLKKNRATDREDWLNGCWAIINICKKNDVKVIKIYELVHMFSAIDDDSYDENGVEKWLNINYRGARNIGYGWRFLLNWLKEDNPEFYSKLTKKYISYEELKKTFELDNFKIIQGAIYGWVDSNRKLNLCKKSDFINHYENLYFFEKKEKKVKKEMVEVIDKLPFIIRWLKDDNIRTYEHIDFIPYDIYEAETDNNIYNLWTGFRAEKYKPINDISKINELIEPIIHHLKEVICGEHYIFMLKYLASIIQRPSRPTGVLILLKGLQGTGKGTIFDNFREYVLGDELSIQTEGLSPIFDRFSNVMVNKLLVQADEISMGEFLSNNIKEKIKNRTTIKKIQYEKKGIDPITINNYSNFILTTNNDNSIVIPYDDRRFVVFQTTDKYLHNTKYFSDLHNHLKREDVSRAFYEYLKNLDISDIDNFQDIRPKTDYYNEMIRLNLSPFHRYLSYITINNELIDSDDTTIERSAINLYNAYINWCECRNYSKEFKYTNTKFGLEMKKMTDDNNAITKKHSVSGAVYMINKEKLKELLVSKKLFDEDIY